MRARQFYMKSEKQKANRKAKTKEVKEDKAVLSEHKRQVLKLGDKIIGLSKRLPSNQIKMEFDADIQEIRKEYQSHKQNEAEYLGKFSTNAMEDYNKLIAGETKEIEKRLNERRVIAMEKEIALLENYLEENNL